MGKSDEKLTPIPDHFANVTSRMLVIVKDAAHMSAVNTARTCRIPGPPRYISTALVANLLRPDMLVEIEVSTFQRDQVC